MTQRNILKKLFNGSKISQPKKDASPYPDAVKLVGPYITDYSVDQLKIIQDRIKRFPEAVSEYGIDIADMPEEDLLEFHTIYASIQKKITGYPKAAVIIGPPICEYSEKELEGIEKKAKKYPSAAKMLGVEFLDTSDEDLKTLQKRATDYPHAASVLGIDMTAISDADELKTIEQRVKDHPDLAKQYGPYIAGFTDEEFTSLTNKIAGRSP